MGEDSHIRWFWRICGLAAACVAAPFLMTFCLLVPAVLVDAFFSGKLEILRTLFTTAAVGTFMLITYGIPLILVAALLAMGTELAGWTSFHASSLAGAALGGWIAALFFDQSLGI